MKQSKALKTDTHAATRLLKRGNFHFMVGPSCHREDNEMRDNAPVFSSSVRSRDGYADAL